MWAVFALGLVLIGSLLAPSEGEPASDPIEVTDAGTPTDAPAVASDADTADDPEPATTNAEVEQLRREVEQLRTRLDTVEKRRRYDRRRSYNRDEEQQQRLEQQSERNREQHRLITQRLRALDRVHFEADFRFRVEHDWHSRNDDGSFRTDRFRFRYRARVGVVVDASEHISFGLRTRTGVPTNMQSPHVNVGYNGFGLAPFNLARAYVKGDYGYFWWWLGKNAMPLWTHNELFWDDDVNPEGVAAGGRIRLHPAVEMRPTAAYFVADHEQIVAYPDSRIVAAQLAFALDPSPLVHVDVAGAYLHMDKIFEVPQHLSRDLWDQGGEVGLRRDRRFLYSQLLATVNIDAAGYALPLSLGFDHAVDLHDNRGDDDVPDHYESQNHMYVAEARFGHNTRVGAGSRRWDWYVGYTFAWKEWGSVVSYYGEDDWVRWGNIHRNRNTNYAGHEVRAALSLGPRIDLLWRLYIVEAIVRRFENNAIALESGNRTRLEVNVRF